jgi:phosphatidylglycerophosphatase A
LGKLLLKVQSQRHGDTCAAFRDPLGFLALGFGSGLAPVAPGTFGTLAAIPIYVLCAQTSLSVYLAILVAGFLAGIAICSRGEKLMGVADSSAIVWDEIIGYLITMTGLPLQWTSVLAGFVLFRFFDILKPWPISWFDRHIKGGLGIMLDDVLAGLFAAVILQWLFHAHWL